MWSHCLAIGEHIRLHDGPYVIDNLLDETKQVQLRHEKTGALKNLSQREFLEDHDHGDLVFVSPDDEEGAGERQPLAKKVFERPLSELPERCRQDTIRRQGYLRRLERRDALHFGRGTALEDAVQEIAAELGDPKPPSRSTIQRWCRKWVARRRDYRAVTCRIDRRGAPGEGRFRDEVETEIAEVIDDYYLTLERPSIRETHAALQRRLEALNRSRASDDLLPVPAERTLDRRIAKLNQYEVVARREGERAAKRRFRAVTGVVHVKRILERVEMDHTPLNLFVVDDETFLPLGRPYLTVALDKKSRCLLGYWVSFTGHGADAVLMCLRHAILAKTYIQQKYPHIMLDWPCHGVPMGVWVDNGAEFTGDDLANACAALGIDLYFLPARRPQWKGSVERFVGRFNHGLIHRIPGTTFENITARKDYDPTKHALITLSDLERLISTWVCD
jgi:putative transposase